MRHPVRMLFVFAALAGGGYVALDAFNVPTFVERHVFPDIRSAYISVFPRDATEADVIKSLRAGVGGVSKRPWLNATSDAFWKGYLSWELSGSSPELGFPTPTALTTVAHRLDISCHSEAEDVLARARLYESGKLIMFEKDTVTLGANAPWNSAPSRDNDVIFIWERSTLQHFVLLAEAYRLTGDDAFVRTIVDQFRQWRAANPAENSVNWRMPMEVALRLTSLLWTESIAGDAPALRSAFPEWSRAVYTHARFIAEHIDRPRLKGNHALFTAVGLYLAAVAHPEWRESVTWRKFAEKRITDELGLQYTQAGVQVEYSPFYHKALLDALLQYAAVKQRLGEPLAPQVAEALKRQVRFLEAMTGPDGKIALFGDSDDHHFVRLDLSTYDDARPTLRLASLLLGMSTGVPATCEDSWGAGWALPNDSTLRDNEITAQAPAKLSIFRKEGFFRAGAGSLTLIGTFATLGATPEFQGHSHADASTFELWSGDSALVVDPGTYTYRRALSSHGIAWRRYMRSSRAHNVTTVDGLSQARPTGDFGFSSWPHSRLVSARRTTDGTILVLGTIDGYSAVVGPVYRLFILRPGWLLVVDWFPNARGTHRYDSRILFADTSTQRTAHGYRVDNDADVAWSAEPGDTVRALVGSASGGWRSPDYGTVQPAAQLSRVFSADGPTATAFVLAGKVVEPPVVSAPRGQSLSHAVVVTTGADASERFLLSRLSSGSVAVTVQHSGSASRTSSPKGLQ